MIVKMIVVRNFDYGYEWIASCWEEELERIKKQYGAENVRISNVEIPDNSLDKAFEEPIIKGKIEK